jgi:hypothetical protein
MNAGHETRLRFEHVPGLLDEHIEPLPCLLGLQMKTTQYGPVLSVIRWDWENRICHCGLPMGSVMDPKRRVLEAVVLPHLSRSRFGVPDGLPLSIRNRVFD